MAEKSGQKELSAMSRMCLDLGVENWDEVFARVCVDCGVKPACDAGPVRCDALSLIAGMMVEISFSSTNVPAHLYIEWLEKALDTSRKMREQNK